jgi:prepilin-type N-terminal cleavage/methylation domain-containing protein
VTAPSRPDDGESLIELLIALAILGIVFVSFLTAMATTASTSDQHRKQANSHATLRSIAEYLQDSRSTGTAPDVASCSASYATPLSNFRSSYQLADGSFPLAGGSPDYVATIESIAYWNGDTTPATFSGSCSSDSGLQRLTLQVRSSDSRAVESLEIAKRKS